MIDVIIPVYRGFEQTRRCIEAALGSRGREPYHVVVIDDASPETDIAALLDSMARDGRIELLRNERNLGFVRTANRGMALHADRDIVLLNSDTEVANDWLDRIHAAAMRADDIATVTPFSNNATICSYPFEGWTGGLPGTLGLAELDRLFAATNAGVAIDIPTAVGFCMYIRRACLAQIGSFDAERFGRGYGEENDFCMRARKAGWRHVLAGDVFVFHEGGVSFSEERHALVRENAHALIEVHPEYNRVVHDFIIADPARPLRDAIDSARARHGEAEAAAMLKERSDERARLLRGLLEIERVAAERDSAIGQLSYALEHASTQLADRDRTIEQNTRARERELAEIHKEIDSLRAGLKHAEYLAFSRMEELDRIHSFWPWRAANFVMRRFSPSAHQPPARARAPGPEAAQHPEPLRLSSKPRVLFVSHGFGGGVRRHIDELARAVGSDVEVFLLTPRGTSFELRRLAGGEPFALWPPQTEWKRIVELLEAIGIDRIHFHHVHGFAPEVLELPSKLACPFDVTLHDHFPICPQYHLLAGDERFCGGEPGCHRCTELGPAQWPLSIDEWRARFRDHLSNAQRVIAPSDDVARRIGRHFPGIAPLVWPHPRTSAPHTRALRVAVPGAISTAKGLSLLVECARDARARALPIHFHVVGYVAHPVPVWPQVPLTIGGEYPEGKLPELLAASGADVLFFPAQVPETHSFTLSDAMDTGLPIVATNLGALPERLADYPRGMAIAWDTPANEVNDAFMKMRPAPRAPASISHATVEEYRDRYLRGIARKEGVATAEIAVDPAWLREPEQKDPPTTTLEWLFDDAFLCGRALSRDKLKSRLRGR